MTEAMNLGVVCGHCGGPVFMETCEMNDGHDGHDWVVASECQRCGARYPTDSGCLDCRAAQPQEGT